MIWEQVTLQKKVSTTTDALGNPVESFETVLSVMARISPFDDIKNSLEGRAVSSSEQYFTIKKTSQSFSFILHDNKEYEVVELIDLPPRWVVARCKEYEVKNQ